MAQRGTHPISWWMLFVMMVHLGDLIDCQELEEIYVRACCTPGNSLNSNKECIPDSSLGEPPENNIFKTLPPTVLKSEPKLPNCDPGDWQLFDGDSVTFSSQGQLITTKYSSRNPINSYCLDTVKGKIVALACNPCARGTCVPLCCPHGQILKNYVDADYVPYRCNLEEHIFEERCMPHDGDIAFNPDWVIQDDNKEILVDIGFECSRGEKIHAPTLYGPTNYSLNGNATLNVDIDPTPRHYGDYCVGLSEHNQALQESAELEYYICYDEQEGEENTVNRFNTSFYPASLYISAFFFLLTIIIYLIIDDYLNNLFHRITFCFLVNALIAYLCLGSNWILDQQITQTSGCVALGYILQHTLIGLFTWVTAMTLKILQITTSFVPVDRKTESNNTTFILYFLIFQGVPWIVSIVTALLDAYGDCSWILPNMGRFFCMPKEMDFNNRNFGTSSIFLYVHLIILIFIIINLICFIVTTTFLIRHWTITKNVLRSNNSKSSSGKKVFLVFKIFIIMGIPWALEIGSAFYVYQKEVGSDDDKYSKVSLALDIWNLFTGVVVFIVLVCKRDILRKLKKKFWLESSPRSSTKTDISMTMEQRNTANTQPVSNMDETNF